MSDAKAVAMGMGPGAYVIRPLNIKDYEDVAQILSSSFTEREPVTKAMGFEFAEHIPFSRSLVMTAVQEGLSFVAEEIATHRVVGFSLSEDFAKPQSSGLPFSPKYVPIMGILDELSRDHKKKYLGRLGVALNILMIGVHSEHTRRGLATTLTQENIAWAKRVGFSSAVAEATATHSQRLFLNLGFQIEREIAYEKFLIDGTNPFRHISEPKTCTFVQRQLTDV